VRTVGAAAAEYPQALRARPDAPAALYVRGTLPPVEGAVAVVGSRAASPYGLGVARALAADLARAGLVVVSGLARGIDTAAHEAALAAGGASVAVVPAGLDHVVPREHRGLAERLAARGALVSEWPAGPPPFRGAFVSRNRIIAALAAATVVVEADEASGALATAAAARGYGRPVLAVPGDVDRPTSRGCLGLLRGGARVCAGAGDVLGVLPRAATGSAPEARMLAALGPRPEPLETLAARAGLGVDAALAALLRLEWAGAAASRPGQRYVRAEAG
jgi:DNA processing protein